MNTVHRKFMENHHSATGKLKVKYHEVAEASNLGKIALWLAHCVWKDFRWRQIEGITWGEWNSIETVEVHKMQNIKKLNFFETHFNFGHIGKYCNLVIELVEYLWNTNFGKDKIPYLLKTTTVLN